jgi:hypothetical protein
MRDATLLDARSFHARLVDLLRVEFASLGALLVALAEFDRERLRAMTEGNRAAALPRFISLSKRSARALAVEIRPSVVVPRRVVVTDVPAAAPSEASLRPVCNRRHG